MCETRYVDFYKLFREEIHESIELRATHFKNFLTILIAISAATLAGAQFFINKPYQLGMVLILGGVTGIISAYLGKELCDGFYKGMLEAVTVSGKLEELLGLEARGEAKEQSFNVFPEDKSFIPKRWLEDRREFPSSDKFIDAHMARGSNQHSRLVFMSFIYGFIAVLIEGVLEVSYSVLLK